MRAGFIRSFGGPDVFQIRDVDKPKPMKYAIAPSRQFALKPASLGHAEAAALALAGLTAWQALHDVAKVQKGQRVLVHAAPVASGISRCKPISRKRRKASTSFWNRSEKIMESGRSTCSHRTAH